jgi:uncharacterized protein (DUF2062 family)
MQASPTGQPAQPTGLKEHLLTNAHHTISCAQAESSLNIMGFTQIGESEQATFTTKQPSRGVTLDMLLPESVREFFRCRILRPLLRQLRGGVTPRRLAWSLALGIVIGINPSVGLTTVVVVALAWMLGLNQIASQIGVHSVAPFHLLLFLPFIELGVHLFHTRRLPLSKRQLEHLTHHPLQLVRDIWQWEWHALIVWGVVAAIALPLLATYIRRGIVLLMRRHRTLLLSRPQNN